MQRALALENSPPLSVALPFFLNVPLFMTLIGLMALWSGPDAFLSRWTPNALVITHLWVLGVLGSAMLGGLVQILPVATGIRPLKRPAIAHSLYVLLTTGTVLLCAGFWLGNRWAFAAAMLALGTTFICLLTLLAWALWTQRRQAFKAAHEVLASARYALVALLLTVLAGLTLAGNHAQWWQRPEGAHELHVLWGLAGWLGLLILSISYQLIPIFQATELYPRWMTRHLARGIVVMLSAASVATLAGPGWQAGSLVAQASLIAAYLIYAACTLQRLAQRKRPSPDVTTLFWLQAMACLILALLTLLARTVAWPIPELVPGILIVMGFGASAVNGMLYKIIPFLLWFNLQRHLRYPVPGVPKVKDILPEHWGKGQWLMHLLATTLSTCAVLSPQHLAYPAAVASLASGLWLGVNSVRALKQFQRASVVIKTALARA